MTTQCTADPLDFKRLGGRRVTAHFDGGDITSDAGALLLRELEETHMSWCEQWEVDFVLGLAKNSRLQERVVEPIKRAKAEFEQTDKPARVFTEFEYQTLDSWSRTADCVRKPKQRGNELDVASVRLRADDPGPNGRFSPPTDLTGVGFRLTTPK